MNEQEKYEFDIHPTVSKVLRIAALALVLLTIYLTANMAITFCLGLFAKGNRVVRLPWQESPIVMLQSEKTKKPVIAPGEEEEIARTDILVTGDILMHMPIVRSAWTGDGYNFDDVFAYIEPYVTSADYASATLETTLSGIEKTFSGFPNFNSPDEIAMGAKNAGFDMLVTATEHCYDFGTEGLLRTLSAVQKTGLIASGTVEAAEEPRHSIQTINDIRIGMASYTYSDLREDGSVGLNGLNAEADAAALVNTFDPKRLSRFYTEIEGELAAMRSGGADITMLYLHWGNEYSMSVSDTQRAMAQKLCDLGVDVIVGSHPHVVQPIDLLTSSNNPDHKTLVVYSAGTLLSNLRAETSDQPSGHTEDGFLLRITLAKYNNDSARVAAVSLIPTWVVVHGSGEERDFCILPLNQQVSDWEESFGLSPMQLSSAKNSYNRTMAIVTTGLNKIASYLSEQNGKLDPNFGVG